MTTPDPVQHSIDKRLLFVLAAGALIVIVARVLFPTPATPVARQAAMSGASSAVEGDPAMWAFTACQQAVTQTLKAPASAAFATFRPEMAESIGADRYRVRSFVDAQNAMGANLRTDFTCEAHHVAGGWQVDSLKMAAR